MRRVFLKKSIVNICATCPSQSEEFKWKMLAKEGRSRTGLPTTAAGCTFLDRNVSEMPILCFKNW